MSKATKSFILEFLLLVIPLFLFFFIIFILVLTPFEITGNSMFETLKENEKIFAEKITYEALSKPPKRGDIVVVKNPKKEGFLIKRVIGLPTENIEFSNGRVYINGIALNEDYLKENIKTKGSVFLKEDIVYEIPQNKYVLLGDNRMQSTDSRTLGFFDFADFEGKVFIVYYPINSIRIIQ